MAKSVWDTIDDPSLDNGNRLPYLYPGKFLLSVRAISHYPSQKKRGEEWFRADFDIVEGATGGKNAVSWVVKLALTDEEALDRSLRDIRAFVRALMGEDHPVNKALMVDLTGDDQPAAGLTVHCEAESVRTKSGGEYTKARWFAVEV